MYSYGTMLLLIFVAVLAPVVVNCQFTSDWWNDYWGNQNSYDDSSIMDDPVYYDGNTRPPYNQYVGKYYNYVQLSFCTSLRFGRSGIRINDLWVINPVLFHLKLSSPMMGTNPVN